MKWRRLRQIMVMTAVLLLPPIAGCASEAAARDADIVGWIEGIRETVLHETSDALSILADPSKAGTAYAEIPSGIVALKNTGDERKAILEVELTDSRIVDPFDCYVGMRLDKSLPVEDIPGCVLDGDTSTCTIFYPEAGERHTVETLCLYKVGTEEHVCRMAYLLDHEGTILRIRISLPEDPIQDFKMVIGDLAALETEKAASEHAAEQKKEVAWRIGKPVSDLIAEIGEPTSVQALPELNGRLLVYPGCIVRVSLEEETGIEAVVECCAYDEAMEGPAGIFVGMTENAIKGLRGFVKSTALTDGNGLENLIKKDAHDERFAVYRMQIDETTEVSLLTEQGAVSCWRIAKKEMEHDTDEI